MMTTDGHHPDQDQSVVTVDNIYSHKIIIQSTQHTPQYLQYKIIHQSNLTLTSGLTYSLTAILILWLWFNVSSLLCKGYH